MAVATANLLPPSKYDPPVRPTGGSGLAIQPARISSVSELDMLQKQKTSMIMKKILSCSKNKKNPLNKHKQPKRNRTQVPSFPKPPNNDVIRAKSQVALQKKIDRLQVPKLRRYSDKIQPLAVKEKPKERRPPGRPKRKAKLSEEELEPQEFVVHYGPDGAISIKQVGN